GRRGKGGGGGGGGEGGGDRGWGVGSGPKGDKPTMKAARRSLTFASLDEVMPDVDRLLEGHTTVGNWSLGQICSHLARAMNGTVDGFPEKAPWLVRKTAGPLLVRWILWRGRFPAGVKLPEEYRPVPGSDARAEADALRAALRRWAAHS